MSNFANMNYSVGMNTADADKQRQQFEQRSIEGAKKVSGQQQQAYNLINRLADKLNNKIDTQSKKWLPVAIAVGTVTAAIGSAVAATQQLLMLTEKYMAVANKTRSLQAFGGQRGDLDAVNKALSHTVDRMTVLQGVSNLRLMGANQAQIEGTAKMAALLAARMGEAKDRTLGLTTQVALTEQHYNALGTSAAAVAQKLAEKEAKRGKALEGSQRQLAELDILLKIAAKSSGGFAQRTAQVGDRFKRAKVRIDEIMIALGRRALPIMASLLEKTQGFARWLYDAGKAVSGFVSTLVKQGSEFLAPWQKLVTIISKQLKPELEYISGLVQRMLSFLSKSVRFVGAITSRIYTTLKKTSAAAANSIIAVVKGKSVSDAIIKSFAEKPAKAAAKALIKETQKAAAKAQAKVPLVKAAGRRSVSDEARERVNEQRAFQLEALNRIRNFSTFALDLASNIGGPVSGVLSALKDYTEQLRIFRAKFGSKFIEQTQGKSIKQLKEMFKTDKARLRAAILLRMSRKAGMLDIKEYVINEKIAALQLKAQIAPNQQIAGLIQNRVERLNIEKDVQGSIKAIKFAEKALEHAKTKEERKGLQFILEKAKQYPKIRAQRLAILAISDKEHKNNLAAAKAQAALDRQSTKLAGREKLLGLQLQLAEAQGRNTGQTKLAQLELQQQQAQLAISQKQAEMQSQVNKLATGRLKVGTEEYNQQLLKIQGLKSEIEVLGQVADLQRRIAHAQMNPKISAIAVQHSQQFGEQLAQNLGGNVASIFETIFTGGDMGETMAKIGLSIMNVLGDTLIAAGVQTMLMGIASLVNPFLGANPGAIAVGGGMILAGGLLKGGAAAAAAGMAERGGSAGSNRARVAEPRTPANTRNQQQQSVTNIYNMQDPYFEGNMSRRVGNLQRQLNRHGTSTGVSLNPRMIRGGR